MSDPKQGTVPKEETAASQSAQAGARKGKKRLESIETQQQAEVAVVATGLQRSPRVITPRGRSVKTKRSEDQPRRSSRKAPPKLTQTLDLGEIEERIKDKKTRSFKCTFPGCKSTFAYQWGLEAHKKTHLGDKVRSFKCQHCDKTFFNASCLRSHVRIHVRKAGSLSCNEPGCNKSYSTSEGLRLHIRNHHSIDKRWICSVEGCGRSFVRQTDLRLHLIRIHSPTRPFPCSFPGCTKSFACYSELKRHMHCHNKTAKSNKRLKSKSTSSGAVKQEEASKTPTVSPVLKPMSLPLGSGGHGGGTTPPLAPPRSNLAGTSSNSSTKSTSVGSNPARLKPAERVTQSQMSAAPSLQSMGSSSIATKRGRAAFSASLGVSSSPASPSTLLLSENGSSEGRGSASMYPEQKLWPLHDPTNLNTFNQPNPRPMGNRVASTSIDSTGSLTTRFLGSSLGSTGPSHTSQGSTPYQYGDIAQRGAEAFVGLLAANVVNGPASLGNNFMQHQHQHYHHHHRPGEGGGGGAGNGGGSAFLPNQQNYLSFVPRPDDSLQPQAAAPTTTALPATSTSRSTSASTSTSAELQAAETLLAWSSNPNVLNQSSFKPS